MATVCPGCSKFASLETQDPEIDESDVEVTDDENGDISISCPVRIVRSSACCDAEMKEANLTLEGTGSHTCPHTTVPEGQEDESERYEVQSVEAEQTDRSPDMDRKGNKIKSYRYRKTFYGADVTVTVQCLWCGAETSIEGHVEEQASAFDELV